MSDPRFPDEMPLGEARDVLRGLADEGHDCPVCKQLVKVYRRKLTKVAARAVVALYADHGLDFAHLPTVAQRRLPEVAHQGGYLVLAAHWSLISEERHLRPDTGRAGYWRVTALGEQWLRGEVTVPKYARLYDGRCLGLDGDLVAASEVLGERFDFAELMRERAEHGADPLFVDRFQPRGDRRDAA
jgi:hypothetical protein